MRLFTEEEVRAMLERFEEIRRYGMPPVTFDDAIGLMEPYEEEASCESS